jgi:hypothetical protein
MLLVHNRSINIYNTNNIYHKTFVHFGDERLENILAVVDHTHYLAAFLGIRYRYLKVEVLQNSRALIDHCS